MNNRFIDKARGRRRQVRVRGYMRDRGMSDYENDMRRSDYDMGSEYHSNRRDYERDYRRGDRYDSRRRDYERDDYDSDYGRYDGHYYEPMGYNIYGGIMPRDYARRDYESDYASGEEDYKKELEKWSNKLKQNDRFNINKEEIIRKAKEMQVKFDEFSEEEFYAIYLWYLSMHRNQFNDPHLYIKMAKDFLSYKDFKLNPSETVWVVLNDIVLGKEGE